MLTIYRRELNRGEKTRQLNSISYMSVSKGRRNLERYDDNDEEEKEKYVLKIRKKKKNSKKN